MRRVKGNTRFKRFFKDIQTHTPFIKMVVMLIVLWIAFTSGLYFVERNVEGATVTSLGEALYWGIAAFSTAGIADTPKSNLGMLIGGAWIIVGSVLFFGTIVATITSYFMRPMQKPVKRIIETIEYNLEQLDDLEVEELELLKKTVDTLIAHVETLKKKHASKK